MKLYVIEADHKRCKVGITENPMNRLKQLESAGGFETINMAYFEVGNNGNSMEKEIHNSLNKYRQKTSFGSKSEWFKVGFAQAVHEVSRVLHTNLKVNIGIPHSAMNIVEWGWLPWVTPRIMQYLSETKEYNNLITDVWVADIDIIRAMLFYFLCNPYDKRYGYVAGSGEAWLQHHNRDSENKPVHVGTVPKENDIIIRDPSVLFPSRLCRSIVERDTPFDSLATDLQILERYFPNSIKSVTENHACHLELEDSPYIYTLSNVDRLRMDFCKVERLDMELFRTTPYRDVRHYRGNVAIAFFRAKYGASWVAEIVDEEMDWEKNNRNLTTG